MPFTRWVRIEDASESPVEDELVVVYGDPQKIAVLDADARALWQALSQTGGVTRAGSKADTFFRELAGLGLVSGEDVQEHEEGMGPLLDAEDRAPRIIHTGAVEVLVYGFTGGPFKPSFKDTDEGETPIKDKENWPWPTPDK